MSSQKSGYHHGNAREALLVAAEEVIKEKGLGGFSLRATAGRVGIDPAACYRHFKNKESILHAIASRGFTRLSQVMAHCQHPDPMSKLLKMGQGYVDFAINNPLVFQIMFGGSGLPALDEQLREAEVEQTAFEQLFSVLGDCFELGSVSEMQLTELAMDVWFAVHGIASLLAFEAVTMDKKMRDVTLARVVHALVYSVNGYKPRSMDGGSSVR